MKILQVVDTPFWAIDKLTQSIMKFPYGIDHKVIYIPPRGVAEKLEEFKTLLSEFNPDVIHFQYWRTAQQLLELVPELKTRKTILSHHNEKNLKEAGLESINCFVAPTTKAYNTLKDFYKETIEDVTDESNEAFQSEIEKQLIVKIPYGIDLDRYHWNDDYKEEIKVGYVGRITRWKRIKPLAKACQELGLTLSVMGRQSDGDYFKEMMDYLGQDESFIEWNLDMPEEDVRDFFTDITILVNNSQDGRETGTLGLLEGMAVGLPIITTPSGMARDICKDGNNCLLLDFNNPVADSLEWEEKNKEDIKTKLQILINDLELRKKLRDNAWNTIKNYTEEKMAREFAKLYYRLRNEPLVSVIIPYTKERNIEPIITAYKNQTYKNIEILPIEDTEEGYNLAKVRNKASIEALGEILIFNDSRICPEQDAVRNIVDEMSNYNDDEKIWFFGEKGGGKDTFVENFSFVRKNIFIRFGLFCERIDRYGAMSEEIRKRFIAQGGQFIYLPDVKATQIVKAHKKDLARRKDIIESKLKLSKMYE